VGTTGAGDGDGDGFGAGEGDGDGARVGDGFGGAAAGPQATTNKMTTARTDNNEIAFFTAFLLV